MSASSQSTEGGDPGVLTKAYRTVTPGYVGRPDTEMNLIGWVYLIGLLAILLPLLPAVALIWLASKIAGFGRKSGT